jgi:hypothetical protein
MCFSVLAFAGCAAAVRDQSAKSLRDEEHSLNTTKNAVEIVRITENLHKTVINGGPPTGDSYDRYQDKLWIFQRLNKPLDGGWERDLVKADSFPGKEKTAVDYIRLEGLEAELKPDYPANFKHKDFEREYFVLQFCVSPFEVNRLIRKLRQSGYFRFVARVAGGAGNGVTEILFRPDEIFKHSASSKEYHEFLADLLNKAFPHSQGFVVGRLKEQMAYNYIVEIVGRGDRMISGKKDNWDKAVVELRVEVDDGATDSSWRDGRIIVQVTPFTTKGPPAKMPPSERFAYLKGDLGAAEDEIGSRIAAVNGWKMW